MSSEKSGYYREISRSCTIVGTLIGAVIAFLFTVIVGAFHGFGVVLFLALTFVIGQFLARWCASTEEGDIFGLGKTLGLHKAEREGKLEPGRAGEAIAAKAAEAKKNAAESEQSQKIKGAVQTVKEAAIEAKEEIKAAAAEVTENTKEALTAPPDPEKKRKQETTSGVPPSPAAPPAEGEGSLPEGGAQTKPKKPNPSTGGTAAVMNAGTDQSDTGSASAEAPPPARTTEIPDAVATPVDPVAEDDLQRISGIGPQASAKLKELGVTTFGQIASWSDDDIAEMERKMGGVSGRIKRDDWVGQAKTLAAGH